MRLKRCSFKFWNPDLIGEAQTGRAPRSTFRQSAPSMRTQSLKIQRNDSLFALKLYHYPDLAQTDAIGFR